MHDTGDGQRCIIPASRHYKGPHYATSEGCTTEAMDVAAGNNYLDIVQWLHANHTQGCTTEAMDQAAANGHFEMVQSLRANRPQSHSVDAIDKAAEGGDSRISSQKQMRCDHNSHYKECLCKRPLERGQVDPREYVSANFSRNDLESSSSRQTDRDDQVVSRTDMKTSLPTQWTKLHRMGTEIPQYLYSHRNEGCTSKVLRKAVINGHVRIVKWLHEMQLQVDDFLPLAATNGHFEIAKFLVDQGKVQLGEDLLNYVAALNHFPILEFLPKHSQARDVQVHLWRLQVIKLDEYAQTESAVQVFVGQEF